MSKSAEFLRSLKSYLDDTFLGNPVDCIVVTPRTIPDALDAGLFKSTVSATTERAGRAILVRRNYDDVANRSGAGGRLLTVGVFDVAVLVAPFVIEGADIREADEGLLLEILDLSDDIQSALEKAPTDAATAAYSIEVRSVVDVGDPSSKYFGCVITIGANVLRV